MYKKVEHMFYGLSAAALMAVLFIATPNNSLEVKQFQTSIVEQTKVALNQIFGSMDPMSDLAFLWNGNNVFYAQSSTELLAMIPVLDEVPAPIQSNIDHLAFGATLMLTRGIDIVLGINQPVARPDVATVEVRGDVLGVQTPELSQTSIAGPIAVPQNTIEPNQKGSVVKWEGEGPVNTQMHPWVTLQDNVTGEAYCVAIYDDEISKYPGACQYNYH